MERKTGWTVTIPLTDPQAAALAADVFGWTLSTYERIQQLSEQQRTGIMTIVEQVLGLCQEPPAAAEVADGGA